VSTTGTNKEKGNSKSKLSTSSTTVNNKDDKEKENKEVEKKSPSIFEFSQEEFNMLNDQYKELSMDNEEFSDLKDIPESPPAATDKELDEIINDPKYKTIITEPGENPPINNTLGPDDRLGKITDEEVTNITNKNLRHKKNLIVLLASKDHINLDIKIGVKEGKSMYIQKSFYYNSLNKKEEFQIKMRNARLSQISHKYTMIINRQDRSWNEQESEFVSFAPAMMEIAAYQQAEMEAKLKLGMSAEDFARVDVTQFQLAQQVIDWRTTSPSFSNLGQ
jgi:hypothetical protein